MNTFDDGYWKGKKDTTEEFEKLIKELAKYKLFTDDKPNMGQRFIKMSEINKEIQELKSSLSKEKE